MVKNGHFRRFFEYLGYLKSDHTINLPMDSWDDLPQMRNNREKIQKYAKITFQKWAFPDFPEKPYLLGKLKSDQKKK